MAPVSSLVRACALSATLTLAVAVNATVTLHSVVPINAVAKTFASWNLDSSCNRGFDFTAYDNANLLAAATGLQPSMVRFGGSGADGLVYGLTPGSPECANVKPVGCDYVTPGCLNSSHWDALYGLAKNSGTPFIFGVSFDLTDACVQGGSYAWNTSNVERLLAYIKQNGQNVPYFELGNEVNNNGPAALPCNLTARQQAAAINTFGALLARELPGALIVGPDTGGANPETWLKALLPLITPANLLHALTHHVYNGISRKDFNAPSQLDNSLPEIGWYTEVARTLAPTAQVWAGENGPIGGGNDGTCGSNSACGVFASSIWYADDMAQRAKHGFVQYQRQDLFGGAYGLVNSPTGAMSLTLTDALSIRPDYWVAFLWKRTLGLNVLNASSSNALIRAYAFSGAPPSPFASTQYCGTSAGGIQLLLLNLANATSSVTLPVVAGGPTSYAAWSLAPTPSGGAFGTGALLNGLLLQDGIDVSKADPRGYLQQIVQPAVTGSVGAAGIVLPPLSSTFVCYF